MPKVPELIEIEYQDGDETKTFKASNVTLNKALQQLYQAHPGVVPSDVDAAYRIYRGSRIKYQYEYLTVQRQHAFTTSAEFTVTTKDLPRLWAQGSTGIFLVCPICGENISLSSISAVEQWLNLFTLRLQVMHDLETFECPNPQCRHNIAFYIQNQLSGLGRLFERILGTQQVKMNLIATLEEISHITWMILADVEQEFPDHVQILLEHIGILDAPKPARIIQVRNVSRARKGQMEQQAVQRITTHPLFERLLQLLYPLPLDTNKTKNSNLIRENAILRTQLAKLRAQLQRIDRDAAIPDVTLHDLMEKGLNRRVVTLIVRHLNEGSPTRRHSRNIQLSEFMHWRKADYFRITGFADALFDNLNSFLESEFGFRVEE